MAMPHAPVEDVVLAVNNAMTNLLGYPHGHHEVWSDWMSIDQTAFNELFNRMRGRRNESTFERLM
jgi:hypothetical protein